MAITDNPPDALHGQFENEERSSDPVFERLAQLASDIRLPWAGSITSWLTRNRISKIEQLIDTIRQELRRHSDQLEKLCNGTQGEAEEFLALVLDGINKAENTRAKERIERIGAILAHSAITSPRPRPDDIEEMMRIAVELSDREVQFLNELVGIQGAIVEAQGRISRFDAWQSWDSGPWGSNPNSDLDSAFSKLESFGLVSRVPPPSNFTITADIQNRFALLRKGVDFVRFAKQH